MGHMSGNGEIEVSDRGNGRSPHYFILTFGCQMNEHDSEVLAGLLEEMGWRAAESPERSDLILANTCCVRESAENRMLGQVGQLKRLKTANPRLLIGICGCLAQRPGGVELIRRRVPHVDLVFGTHNLQELPQLVERARNSRGMVVSLAESPGEPPPRLPRRRVPGRQAWITVIYGCTNFCSYCIVPYTRGPERSRPPADILDEARRLAGEGVVEVTLLGQNVNAYGLDLDSPTTFAALLTELDRIPELRRIRYTTSHPRDFTQELIEAIASSRAVCEHFHLPVQAGSDRVLTAMNRGYTRDQYMDLIARIRRAVPGASITTDVIVGFPGESEEDFAATLDLFRRVRFDSAFTFLYSPRSGTAAADMPGQLSPEEKKERLQRLMDLQYEIAREKNLALEGERVEVLVEGPSKTDPSIYSGRTRTNKLVLFPGEERLIGEFVTVLVEQGQTFQLKGRVCAAPAGGSPA